MTAPCKGCADRTVGCHGHCERYTAFRAYKDEIKRKKAEEQLYAELVTTGYKRTATYKRKNRRV